ncbi:MAG: tetratricopeptide repeat protein [Spirulinaceae cyanobacterium]
MSFSVDVNQDNFAKMVLAASHQRLVVADFYATWCGPCKLLKPILEKLAPEYGFILAKIDTDKNPELASQYGIEGVPDVRIFMKGEMYPGFVGAKSEEYLRELLGTLGLQSTLEAELEQAQMFVKSGDAQSAKESFDSLFEKYPNNPKVAIAAAQFLIQCDRAELASQMLDTVETSDRTYTAQIEAMKALISLHAIAKIEPENELDEQFIRGAKSALAQDYEGALQAFLDIVERDRTYRDDGARKVMLTLFELLGKQHPLTQKYQQELTLVLF